MPCARSTDWPCEHVAVGVTGGVEATHGEVGRRFEWASVTKLATAVAMLVAAEEGLVDLDEPAGPPGLDVAPSPRPCLGPAVRPRPADLAARRSTACLLELRLRRRAPGSSSSAPTCRSPSTSRTSGRGRPPSCTAPPARASQGTLADLLVLARELQAPTRLAPETLAEASDGAVPGARRRAARLRPPGAERLGPRRRAARREVAPLDRARNSHRRRSVTSAAAARSSGSILSRGSRSPALTDLAFGDWAAEAWPPFADAVTRPRFAESSSGLYLPPPRLAVDAVPARTGPPPRPPGTQHLARWRDRRLRRDDGARPRAVSRVITSTA